MRIFFIFLQLFPVYCCYSSYIIFKTLGVLINYKVKLYYYVHICNISECRSYICTVDWFQLKGCQCDAGHSVSEKALSRNVKKKNPIPEFLQGSQLLSTCKQGYRNILNSMFHIYIEKYNWTPCYTCYRTYMYTYRTYVCIHVIYTCYRTCMYTYKNIIGHLCS